MHARPNGRRMDNKGRAKQVGLNKNSRQSEEEKDDSYCSGEKKSTEIERMVEARKKRAWLKKYIRCI